MRKSRIRFMEHFLWITYAMDRIGENHDEMWDAEDGFYYDLLHFPNGDATRLKVRSMVGLLPLCASTVLRSGDRGTFSQTAELIALFRKRHPGAVVSISRRPTTTSSDMPGDGWSVCNKKNCERILAVHARRERIFRSIRHTLSITLSPGSSVHRSRSAARSTGRSICRPNRTPACSAEIPTGADPSGCRSMRLLIRALLNLYQFYGDDFKVECPTGSGTVHDAVRSCKGDSADDSRASSCAMPTGKRPVYGGTEKFQADPHWRDYILFYEYFHGDNGAGLGASHQTGWTGLVARLIDMFARLQPADLLATSERRCSRG